MNKKAEIDEREIPAGERGPGGIDKLSARFILIMVGEKTNLIKN